MSQEKSQKINKYENDKIVQLIKSKLTPMHKKVDCLLIKQRVFPRILQPIDLNLNQTNNNSFGGYMYKDLPICEKHVRYDRQIDKKITSSPLFRKVQHHIEEKKKVLGQQQIENARLRMPRISLGSYIELFSRPEQVDYSKTVTQFNKFKRQSLALNVFDNIESSGLKENQNRLNEAEIVLMNAKFRKQLNHRKLIGIWKIRNKT